MRINMDLTAWNLSVSVILIPEIHLAACMVCLQCILKWHIARGVNGVSNESSAGCRVGFSCLWPQLLQEPVMRDYSEDTNTSLGSFSKCHPPNIFKPWHCLTCNLLHVNDTCGPSCLCATDFICPSLSLIFSVFNTGLVVICSFFFKIPYKFSHFLFLCIFFCCILPTYLI